MPTPDRGGRRDGAGGRPAGSVPPPRSTRGTRSAPRGRGDERKAPHRYTGAGERTPSQRRYDGPELPDDVSGDELSAPVRRQLSSLPDRLAQRVARHLVMAGRLLHEDPATAYRHAQAARARAGRLAIVREACGEAAYFAGEFGEALAELRAARRMNGSSAYLPMLADCERALGRPDRALTLSRDEAVRKLDDAGRVEMTIVAAGARRDRGELAAALATLESAPLHTSSRAPWVARLRYAYADALLEAGRVREAAEWFHRTIAVDVDAATDAAERLAELGDGGGGDQGLP